jgi:hypothetical protein
MGPRGVERCVPGAHAKMQLKGLKEWKAGYARGMKEVG